MSAAAVTVGSLAPDFTLAGPNGQTVRLSSFRGRNVVVLYFYPRDFTAVCTAEACLFRDRYEAFRDAGAVVIGVSPDPPARHASFAEKHNLPFHLLADPEGAARRAYGVRNHLLLLPGRETFVIDTSGRVRHAFRSAGDAQGHVAGALEIVKRLATEGR